VAEWQTHWIQNPARFTPRVGSTPTFGTVTGELQECRRNVLLHSCCIYRGRASRILAKTNQGSAAAKRATAELPIPRPRQAAHTRHRRCLRKCGPAPAPSGGPTSCSSCSRSLPHSRQPAYGANVLSPSTWKNRHQGAPRLPTGRTLSAVAVVICMLYILNT
jgi:hypothetical protein